MSNFAKFEGFWISGERAGGDRLRGDPYLGILKTDLRVKPGWLAESTAQSSRLAKALEVIEAIAVLDLRSLSPTRDREIEKEEELSLPDGTSAHELLDEMLRTKKMHYQMLGLDTCAIAQTMDRFLPGFWSRFMENRQAALKDFLERQREERKAS